jgi:hypothetical protein
VEEKQPQTGAVAESGLGDEDRDGKEPLAVEQPSAGVEAAVDRILEHGEVREFESRSGR